MTIDIIGAGIGGLTTAIALQQAGIKSRVFEQSKVIKPVGAGIILANNAMQVFRNLGLKDQIESSGNTISSLCITDARLTTLSKVNLQFFEKKYGVKNVAIHRGSLQQLLANSLPEKDILLDHQLENVTVANDEVHLTFLNQSPVTSTHLLGADGINSVVRKSLFTAGTIRDPQQFCWRGITEFSLPATYRNELNEAWGQGDRFGFVQIAPKKVYWYALKSFKQTPNQFSNHLSDYFKTYHPIINEMIQSTPANSIHTSAISDLKPVKRWCKQNVCLLGDAAHATTPNMGQGACQAVEDAYVIAECLKKYEVEKAFTEFQKLRMPKAHQVVNTSWKVGKLAHWQHPLAILLRNQFLNMIPERISLKQSERIFELNKV